MPLSRLRARKARPPTVSWRSGFATTALPGRRIAGPSASLCFRPFAFAGRCLKMVVPPSFVLPKRTRPLRSCSTDRSMGRKRCCRIEHAAQGGVAPQWLEQRLATSEIAGAEADALLDRATLDLRVNTLKADRTALALPVEAQPTVAPNGLRIATGTQVEEWSEWREGKIEVQDTGSQLACLAVDADAGETIVDLCAGGGGKTLALAAAMDNLGRLIASDTDRGRLSRLLPRAERAGATNIETRLLDPKREFEALADLEGQADAVLIDAPMLGHRHLAAQSGSALATRRGGIGPPDRTAVLSARSRRAAGQTGRALDLRHLLAARRGRRRPVRSFPIQPNGFCSRMLRPFLLDVHEATASA